MSIFEAAHETYKSLKSCKFESEGCVCLRCGKKLETTYLEERLYAVRCKKCNILSFVIANNPATAERKVGKSLE